MNAQSTVRKTRGRPIWHLQSKLTNYFYPQQKLISKVRHGAKISKKHDTAATPFHRAINHPTMTEDRITALARTHARINPAATQRRIQALTAQLHTITTSKARARTNKRAPSHEPAKLLRAHLDMSIPARWARVPGGSEDALP
jgi:hypothetical protein